MPGLGSVEQVGRGRIAQVFVWGGVLLLLVGGFLIYPYVSSRLVVLPSTPIPTPPINHPTTALFTAARLDPTSTPEPSILPTAPPLFVATPTPALPTRIVIPAIHVDAPIEPVSWYTVEVGAQVQTVWGLPQETYSVGWHETSAPLGVRGNTVLNGHNTTHGEVFRYLYTLDTGDTIVVYSGDAPYTYTVSETLVLLEAGQPVEVRQENARYASPTDDERLTLITCHPYGSVRNRLIVIAYPEETHDE